VDIQGNPPPTGTRIEKMASTCSGQEGKIALKNLFRPKLGRALLTEGVVNTTLAKTRGRANPAQGEAYAQTLLVASAGHAAAGTMGDQTQTPMPTVVIIGSGLDGISPRALLEQEHGIKALVRRSETKPRGRSSRAAGLGSRTADRRLSDRQWIGAAGASMSRSSSTPKSARVRELQAADDTARVRSVRRRPPVLDTTATRRCQRSTAKRA